MKNIVISFVLIIALWGCEHTSSPGDPQGVNFRTDQSSYALSKDETISLSIENNSGIQYYVAEPSHNLTLAKKSAEGWENLGSWYMTVAMVPEPIPLDSTDVFPRDILIDGIQDVFSLEEGQYRFEYILYLDKEADPDSEKTIHTNSFSFQP